jgi:hypothetical protein
MSNGIYLTLEQYKDKDLPLTITVNGNTYHSQFALATAQTTWFEMGKQHGMELGSENTYSDKEMARMHNAWYDEGYEAGIDHGIEQTLQDDRVKEELERTKQIWYATGKAEGYGEGYNDGYEQCKHDNQFEDDYCKDCKEEPGKDEQNAKEIPGEWLSHIEEARLMGYAEGYSDAKEGGHAEGYEDYITERQKTSFVDWLNSKKR